LIDAEVDPVKERVARSEAFSGNAGLEVATALLMNPKSPVAVRELARSLHRSPSTVSEILAALRRDDLIATTNTVVGDDLFWAVASRWAPVVVGGLAVLSRLSTPYRQPPIWTWWIVCSSLGGAPGEVDA